MTAPQLSASPLLTSSGRRYSVIKRRSVAAVGEILGVDVATVLSDLLRGRSTRQVDDRDGCRHREGCAEHCGDHPGENVVHLSHLLLLPCTIRLRGLYQGVLAVPRELGRGQPRRGRGHYGQRRQVGYQHRRPRWDHLPRRRDSAHAVEIEIASDDDRIEILQYPGWMGSRRAVLDGDPADP